MELFLGLINLFLDIQLIHYRWSITDEFNISKSEIVAFGDDINDKEMFSNCGLSVAMDNAIDEIKNSRSYLRFK